MPRRKKPVALPPPPEPSPYAIKGLVGGGYNPKNNFHLTDLAPELYQNLMDARPDLIRSGVNQGIQEIIDALELSSNSWQEDSEKFVIQTWETGEKFLREAGGYDSSEIINLYLGEDPHNYPSARDIVDIFEDESEEEIHSWKRTNPEVKQYTPNYLQNLGLSILYENPRAMPADFDLTDKSSIEELMENASSDGKDLKAYYLWLRRKFPAEKDAPKPQLSPALELAVDIYSVTQPSENDADSEVEYALENLNADSEFGTEIDWNGVESPCYQTLEYDKAKKYADEVSQMGKRVPDWDRDVRVLLGGSDWFSSDNYRDYLKEQLEEHFSEQPLPPPGLHLPHDPVEDIPWNVPPEQGRLFKFPETNEEARANGIRISGMNNPLLLRRRAEQFEEQKPEGNYVRDAVEKINQAAMLDGHPVGMLKLDLMNQNWILVDQIPTNMGEAETHEAVELFKDWTEYAFTNLLDVARRRGIKYVAIHVAEVSPGALRYIVLMAEGLGFHQQKVKVGEGEKSFWVMEVSKA